MGWSLGVFLDNDLISVLVVGVEFVNMGIIGGVVVIIGNFIIDIVNDLVV